MRKIIWEENAPSFTPISIQEQYLRDVTSIFTSHLLVPVVYILSIILFT